tara:strand:- start:2695 stop:3090 length:396 start_codon:yes stop_codon:yes gene_type:complete
MATTTAQITLISSDLTTDALSLTTTATLTDTGSSVGVTETSGLSRKITTANSEYTLLAEADYADDKAHKIYVKHVGTTASDRVDVKLASQNVGRLYAGDWMFIPWNGDTDVKLTPNVSTSVTVEYMVIIAS